MSGFTGLEKRFTLSVEGIMEAWKISTMTRPPCPQLDRGLETHLTWLFSDYTHLGRYLCTHPSAGLNLQALTYREPMEGWKLFEL